MATVVEKTDEDETDLDMVRQFAEVFSKTRHALEDKVPGRQAIRDALGDCSWFPAAGERPAKTQEEQDLEALDYRSTGMTYRQIAKVQEVHVATAYARVQRAIGRQRQAAQETPGESREILEMKLDRMERSLMPAAATGDHAAVRLVLRINELRLRWMKEAARLARDGTAGQVADPPRRASSGTRQNGEQMPQETPLPFREGSGEGQAADCLVRDGSSFPGSAWERTASQAPPVNGSTQANRTSAQQGRQSLRDSVLPGRAWEQGSREEISRNGENGTVGHEAADDRKAWPGKEISQGPADGQAAEIAVNGANPARTMARTRNERPSDGNGRPSVGGVSRSRGRNTARDHTAGQASSGTRRH